MLALQAFCILLAAFLLVDLIAWLMGWHSLTQEIIAAKNRDPIFRVLIILLLLIAMAFLTVHFELIR